MKTELQPYTAKLMVLMYKYTGIFDETNDYHISLQQKASGKPVGSNVGTQDKGTDSLR